MAVTNEIVVSTLNDLVEICHDGANGFRLASEGLKDQELRPMFARYAEQRTGFANELEALVSQYGGKPAQGGTAGGAMHRGWMNIKKAIAGNEDAAIIAECETGEDTAKEAYQTALSGDLPATIRAVIERQYQQVLEAHDAVRRLEIQTNG